MMTGELLRIVKQLGGEIRLTPNGGLKLAGIHPAHDLRDMLVRVIKLPFHKTEILRRLKQEPFTIEEMREKLEEDLQTETKLKLFGPGDAEFDFMGEIHAAAQTIDRENQEVDAMLVGDLFANIVPGKDAALRLGATVAPVPSVG